jgi:MtN3 and saliva related transmembrane protein
MTEALGWLSSATLLFTIGAQVHKQWAAGTSKGVSVWLFIGQFAASLGFLGYSVLIHNWVFVVTNGLMAAAALLGLGIVFMHRRREHGRHGRADSATASGFSPSSRSSRFF